ncbi:MAG: DUF4912 domain-containing protein [Elusimicrobia bacterium]|nr:DUF4912 domain-containing protein [Elusimicrobiota bacterium]
MRIYELARELKVETAQVLKAAKKLRFRKKYAISTLTHKQEKKLRDFFKKSKKKARKKVIGKIRKEMKKAPSSPVKKKKVKEARKKPFIDMGPSLPEKYRWMKVIILPRDPSTVFAYWDIDEKFLRGSLVLRVYEVEKKKHEFKDRYYFDIHVKGNPGNWYINVPHPGARYRAEIGVIEFGKFYPIAKSNVILVPRNTISDEVDEEWMIVKEDLQKIIKYTGLDRAARSSLRKAQTEIRNILEMIKMRIPSSISSAALQKKK